MESRSTGSAQSKPHFVPLRRGLAAGPQFLILIGALALGLCQAAFAVEEVIQTLPVKGDAEAATVSIPNRPIDARHVNKRRAKHVRASRQRLQWWAHSREVLFVGLELNDEQSKTVDEIIATQMKNRTTFSQLDTQLASAMSENDRTRAKQLRSEVRVARQNLKSVHQLFEQMRAVLDEDQQKVFDRNRAKLVAEGQATGQKRKQSAKRKRKKNKGVGQEEAGEKVDSGDEVGAEGVPGPKAVPPDGAEGVPGPKAIPADGSEGVGPSD